MDELALKVGVSGEVVRFGLVLLLGFPISLIYKLIPAQSIQVKHLYSIVTTAVLTATVFSYLSLVKYVITCCSIYGIAYVFKANPYMPIVCFAIALVQLLTMHWQNQVMAVDNPADTSSMMMVLLIKLSAFSYCCYDGTKPEKELDSYQKSHCIKEMPSLVEFLGYCFFFNGVWVGPAIEFQHYRSFIRCEGPYQKIPNTTFYVLKTLALGAIMIYCELRFGEIYHFRHCLGDKFLNQTTFFGRLRYITISGWIVRAKFHAVWKISESAALLSGVGYGKSATGEDRFDLAENVNVHTVEMGENVKVIMDAWNKFTANWLRRYVYVRVSTPTLKLPLTFLVSAVWHGFYPGYYLTFLSTVPLTESGRALRKYIRPIFVDGGRLSSIHFVYDLVGRCCAMFCLNYLVVSFILHTWVDSYYAWKSIYFLGHIMLLSPFLFLNVFRMSKIFTRWHGKNAQSKKEK